jgi:hypothetical protein
MPPSAAATDTPRGSRLVAAFARDVPWWDDWNLVPVLSGREPASAAWLWERHNEHRIPIPELIHLTLAAPAGADFRAAPYLNALGLSAGAFALFPLALLNWGQYGNLLWSFQVQFVCSTVLFLLAVALLTASARPPGARRTLLAGLCATYRPIVHAVAPELLAERLTMLRRARLGPYCGLPAEESAVNTMNGEE